MNVEFDQFVEELLTEKIERPMIIVGASKVDDLLKSIINKYLLPKPQKDEDLLDGDRPLGTFSSRMKLCYRLGIIDKDFLFVLEQLRAIRNKSAHGIAFNVKKSPIKDHIDNLKNGICRRKSYQLTTQRYFDGNIKSNEQELQCMLITLCVLLQAIFETIGVTKGINETLKISRK